MEFIIHEFHKVNEPRTMMGVFIFANGKYMDIGEIEKQNIHRIKRSSIQIKFTFGNNYSLFL